jgi:Branched-chain amino acid transport system / permease component
MLLFDFLLAGLVIGGIYALISIGLNLQYGVARVLNLAYGEFLMLAGYGAFWGFTLVAQPPLLTLLLAAPLAFALSWLLFRYLLHPLLQRTRDAGKREIDSILATFGLLFVLQGAALVAWSGDGPLLQLPRPTRECAGRGHERQSPAGSDRRAPLVRCDLRASPADRHRTGLAGAGGKPRDGAPGRHRRRPLRRRRLCAGGRACRHRRRAVVDLSRRSAPPSP